MKINLYLPAFLLMLLGSCENPGSIGLDDDTISDGVIYTDTLTVETSTVYAGPIPTSNTNQLLVGGYSDDKLGRIRSVSYFKISPESSSFALDREVTFDSIALVIRCSGYYYGDTTAAQTLNVFRLREDIEAEELPANPEGVPVSYLLTGGQLYHDSHFEYEASSPLASVRVRPRPSGDTLHIRLPDELGEEWMHLSGSGDDRISSAEEFSDYFKGLVLAGGAEENAALIGYRADTSFVRLYYREEESDGTISAKHTDFFLYRPDLQFNEILTDRSGTFLEGLGPSRPVLPAAASAGETYLQAGAGLMTRLSFPYLKSFLETAGDSSLSVHSVQLLIEPVSGTFGPQQYLPASLALYYTGERPVPLYPVQDEQTGGINTGVFHYDSEFPDKTWYKFHLTGYFSQLLNNYDGTRAELLLSQPVNDISASVTRLCIGSSGHRNKAQLIIYYTPGK
ncbi:MAG TPA: DUF4270 family protein [Anseongella sp.]|nr:DUF4270 family protein [Anseongella sp.]